MRHPCPRCRRSCQGGPRACCWYCKLLARNRTGAGRGGNNLQRTAAERELALPDWKLRLLRRRAALGVPLFGRRARR